jgi:hypothetical protein
MGECKPFRTGYLPLQDKCSTNDVDMRVIVRRSTAESHSYNSLTAESVFFDAPYHSVGMICSAGELTAFVP